MSYQVLARKWRPQTFQAMVGQEPILRMLMNALDHQRLHHAYLFTGTRGVGKTSLARLFAKCLNCDTGITSNPCGTCKTCLAIDAGKFLDLIEVDGASRTKVEDTRELLDNVQYTPSQGRFKIYLIDEVHMLSGHSFNALLKTLEEPPAHVKFLLATTDPKKLPITILSRCLQFNLKRVPLEKITQQLAHICTSENKAFDLPALELLAQAADGSMRDALSLLDQTISFCNEKITTLDTRQMLGSIEQDAIFKLLNAIRDNSGTALLDEIAALAEHAPDFSQVLEELLSTLHEINVAQIIKTATGTIQNFAENFSPEDVQLYYQIALIGRRDLALAPTPRQGFEMIMLRMLAFKPATSEPEIKKKIKLETTPAPETIKKPVGNNWSEILPQLKLTGMSQALAANCTLIAFQGDKIELALASMHQPMLNKKLEERIEQALTDLFNKPIKLDIKIVTTDIETPAKQQQLDQTLRQANAMDAIKNDTQVKKMMDVFNATLDMSSIKAVKID